MTTGMASGNIAAEDMERSNQLLERIHTIFESRVVGQEALYTALVASLLARGHVLLESVPGLAKTTAATTIA